MRHTRRAELDAHVQTYGHEPAKDLFDILGRESGRKYLEISEQARYARNLLSQKIQRQTIVDKLQSKFGFSVRTAQYRITEALNLKTQ